jgi:hypothetical protein
MAHKQQKATRSRIGKQSSGIKTFKTNVKYFSIDINKYGGSVDKAKEKIASMFTDVGVKTKIKELVLTPTDGENMFKVKLLYKIWI